MWNMPRNYLRIVLVLVGICAAAGFILGVSGTPPRGHLPGEVEKGQGGVALDALDAKPLPDTVPQIAARTQDKRKIDDKKTEIDPLEAQAQAAATATPQKNKTPDDKLGDLLDAIAPPAEDPPH